MIQDMIKREEIRNKENEELYNQDYQNRLKQAERQKKEFDEHKTWSGLNGQIEQN